MTVAPYRSKISPLLLGHPYRLQTVWIAHLNTEKTDETDSIIVFSKNESALLKKLMTIELKREGLLRTKK